MSSAREDTEVPVEPALTGEDLSVLAAVASCQTDALDDDEEAARLIVGLRISAPQR